MTSNSSSLIIAPDFSQPEYIQVTPQSAQWEHLSFAARQLNQGATWDFETQDNELALVVLGGVCEITSNMGNWTDVGRRPNVFSGMPYTLYLPPGARFSVEAKSHQLDIAYGWAKAQDVHPACLVKPAEVEIEIRGGDNVTRQINKMIPPGFPASRLTVVEVYTPSGNWSSYPPHKHDEHIVDASGKILEADLEEVYFYKIDRPEGFAYQRIYTRDRKLDELLLARDSHLVLSPYGYHPVVAAPGYNCYYLNMLAGSAQSLTATDDPDHAWVKETWKEKDPRLPLVSLEMENERSLE
jgi:5-deoxy-glucuronate isomerase